MDYLPLAAEYNPAPRSPQAPPAFGFPIGGFCVWRFWRSIRMVWNWPQDSLGDAGRNAFRRRLGHSGPGVVPFL